MPLSVVSLKREIDCYNRSLEKRRDLKEQIPENSLEHIQQLLKVATSAKIEFERIEKKDSKCDRNVYVIQGTRYFSTRFVIAASDKSIVKGMIDENGRRYVLWSRKFGLYDLHLKHWERMKRAYEVLEGCEGVVFPKVIRAIEKPCGVLSTKIIVPSYGRGDLFEIFTNEVLSRRQKFAIGLEVLKVIERIHAKGIIHGDIKLENFVVNEEWKVGLIDFEFSFTENDEFTDYLVGGTEAALAPEYYYHLRKTSPFYLTDKVDVWAAACLLQELRMVPDPNEFTGIQFFNVWKRYKLKRRKRIEDTGLLQLMQDMMANNPAMRLTAAEAREQYENVMQKSLS